MAAIKHAAKSYHNYHEAICGRTICDAENTITTVAGDVNCEACRAGRVVYCPVHQVSHKYGFECAAMLRQRRERR